MGIIIENKKHYLIRFPLWLLIIIVIGFSPILIGALGSYLTELITNKPCHEGNCIWMVLPWMMLFTLPFGGVLLIIYLIIIIIDSIKLFKKSKHNSNIIS